MGEAARLGGATGPQAPRSQLAGGCALSLLQLQVKWGSGLRRVRQSSVCGS